MGGTAQITLLGTLSYPLPCSSTPWCPAWPASSHFSLLGYIGFFGGGSLFPTRFQPCHHKMPHSREGQDWALRSRFFYEAISSRLLEGLPTRQVTKGALLL